MLVCECAFDVRPIYLSIYLSETMVIMWNVFICSFSLETFGGIMVDRNTCTRMFDIAIIVIVKVKKLVNKYSAVILVISANAKKLLWILRKKERKYTWYHWWWNSGTKRRRGPLTHKRGKILLSNNPRKIRLPTMTKRRLMLLKLHVIEEQAVINLCVTHNISWFWMFSTIGNLYRNDSLQQIIRDINFCALFFINSHRSAALMTVKRNNIHRLNDPLKDYLISSATVAFNNQS